MKLTDKLTNMLRSGDEEMRRLGEISLEELLKDNISGEVYIEIGNARRHVTFWEGASVNFKKHVILDCVRKNMV